MPVIPITRSRETGVQGQASLAYKDPISKRKRKTKKNNSVFIKNTEAMKGLI